MRDEGGGASRSTDSAWGTSQATDVSLREHLTELIRQTEKRSDERFEAMQKAVDAAFASSQRAIDKTNEALDKRFEGVNEFRQTLSDQAVTFVTKDSMSALTDKLQASIDNNRRDLDALAKRLDLREGQEAGSKLTTGTLVTIITVGVGVIGLIVVIANVVTG
jgi:DNA anti-recombination protein RmuC